MPYGGICPECGGPSFNGDVVCGRCLMQMPIVTLTNGLRVANFSSPHPFQFVDGSELPACSPHRSREMMLEAIEREDPHPVLSSVTDIRLDWRLPERMCEELDTFAGRTDIDVVLVPLPVMVAIKKAARAPGKCRVIRVADRISKKIHIDRFCV